MKDYPNLDATAMAELIAAKDVKPIELVDEAISRIDRANPKVNAVIWRDFENARAQAQGDLPDGLFRGVPYLLKDLALQEGAICTFGSVFFREFRSGMSSAAVERMLASGLISLGRTNSPEFGLLPTTEPVLHGSTNNPWELSHSAGGSSGGAAAAVAAGMLPMAHATDGGGSIRIPASINGLFGLKPTRGRTPRFPPVASDYISVDLCVSRSVRDTARMLDVLAGALPGAMYWAPPPTEPFRRTMYTDPGSLRIAFATDDMRGRAADPDCVHAVEQAATLLESLGHVVLRDKPALDPDQLSEAFQVLWSAATAGSFELILEAISSKRSGRTARRALGDWRTLKLLAKLDERKSGLEAFEPFTWDLVNHARHHSAVDLMIALDTLQAISHEVAAFTSDYDLMLWPVLATPPMPNGWIDQNAGLNTMWDQLERYVPYTPIANFTGRPAMSVPLHWTSEGLPVGVQFVADFGDEMTLLQLAHQLEGASPWWNRISPVAASQPNASS
ncbi:MAG: amidase [bacterium]|nr:amidase [bacterium]